MSMPPILVNERLSGIERLEHEPWKITRVRGVALVLPSLFDELWQASGDMDAELDQRLNNVS